MKTLCKTKTFDTWKRRHSRLQPFAMPRGQAAAMREAVSKENVAELVPEQTPWNKTGFVGVQKAGSMFRARLQVPGDGRGGTTKRRQYHVPGLFNTAEEAAVALAIMKRDMMARNGGKVAVPEQQYKPRKSSGKKPCNATAAPLLPVVAHELMATAMAVPIASLVLHVPIAVASPLPRLPLGVAAPL